MPPSALPLSTPCSVHMSLKTTHLICAVFSWYSTELDNPVGQHEGTVQGVRYFATTDNHGVFATEHPAASCRRSEANLDCADFCCSKNWKGPSPQSFSRVSPRPRKDRGIRQNSSPRLVLDLVKSPLLTLDLGLVLAIRSRPRSRSS